MRRGGGAGEKERCLRLSSVPPSGGLKGQHPVTRHRRRCASNRVTRAALLHTRAPCRRPGREGRGGREPPQASSALSPHGQGGPLPGEAEEGDGRSSGPGGNHGAGLTHEEARAPPRQAAGLVRLLARGLLRRRFTHRADPAAAVPTTNPIQLM